MELWKFEDQLNFGKFIKRRRLALNISQEQLALMLRMSSTSIHKVEKLNDHGCISWTKIKPLSRILKCKVSTLANLKLFATKQYQRYEEILG